MRVASTREIAMSAQAEATVDDADASHSPSPEADAAPAAPTANTATRAPTTSPALGLLLIWVLGGVLLIGGSTLFGLWEPWETVWAELARHMRESGDWFTPILDGRAVPRPLLHIWLIAAGQSLGRAEWMMRLPLALATLGGVTALYLWLRQVFSNTRAVLAALAGLTCVQVLLGGMTLAGEGAFAATAMLAVGLFGALLAHRGPAPPRGLQVGFGVAVALCTLAWGLWGMVLPLALVGAVGIWQLTSEPAESQTPLRRYAPLVAFGVVAAAMVAWTAWQQFNPYAQQLLLAVLPLSAVATTLAAARNTRAVKALGGPAMTALILAIPALTAALIGGLFTPTPSQVVTGFAPLWQLLDNHVVSPTQIPTHISFDFWMRQLGFGTFPWIALLPVGLAWLLRRDEAPPSADEATALDARRLLASWLMIAIIIMGVLGTAHERYVFPAAASVGVMGALMLSDADFWTWLRARPHLMRLAGVLALMILLVVAKDLSRYPRELAGALLLDGELTLPEGFAYGSSLKVARYGLMALLAIYSFCVVAGGIRWGRRLFARRSFDAQLADARAHDLAPPAEPGVVLSEQTRVGLIDAAIRREPGPLGRLAAMVENPERFGAVFGAAVLVTAAFVCFSWVPGLSHHLTLKGLLETYEKVAHDGEPLKTFQVDGARSSYYFADLEAISGNTEFINAVKAPERTFFVLPTSRLSALNYDLRKDTEPRQNIHVLDSRNNRYLLASNQLREGEQEMSPVAQAILPGKPRPNYPAIFPDEAGVRQYPQFDARIQLTGYDLFHADEVDSFGNPTPEALTAWQARKKLGEAAVFKTGEQMVIRYYFKVLKRIPSSYKIFLHVDYPGTRINGDHTPVNEAFPTNHWLPGDYIVDTQWLLIEPGSSSGTYQLYAGFFLGNNRMKVTPASAHDGGNRVKLGAIEVTSF